MDNLDAYLLELLAFTLLSLCVVLRHNWLQGISKKIHKRHSGAPKPWWIDHVPKRDTNSPTGAGRQR